MSYRVEYDSKVKWEQCTKPKGSYRVLLTGLFLMLFFLLVNFGWEEGKELLFQLMLPGDAHVTWNGMQQLSENLSSGIPLQFAIREFYNEILQGCY